MKDAFVNYKLAIVIPAYKTKYLRESLQSIAEQTNRHFRLYIGDDASPERVAEIVREFSKELPLKYHRFEHNLGATSLVQQWERCIRLSEEPWVWLFSDDDTMAPGCVAAFYEVLAKADDRHDLYRFNTVTVNTTQNTTQENPPHPEEETGVDFLLAKLRGTRRSTFQELIFSRQAWEASGGIPDFPLAWAADDAFTARLGGCRPIRTILGPRVSWRLSDLNISNDDTPPIFHAKLKASEEFIRWVIDYFEQRALKDKKTDKAEILRLTENWLFTFVECSWRFMDLQASQRIEELAAKVWGHSTGYGFLKTQQANLRHLKRKCSGRIKRLLEAYA
jgi:Glycosyl transferase family 2